MESRAGGDVRCASLHSVTHLRGTDEPSLPPHFHPLHASIPTLDHVSRPQDEIERLRAIESVTVLVCELAHVRDHDGLANLGDSSVAFDEIFEGYD